MKTTQKERNEWRLYAGAHNPRVFIHTGGGITYGDWIDLLNDVDELEKQIEGIYKRGVIHDITTTGSGPRKCLLTKP